MPNNIVKHSYIKGKDLTARATAHIDYIQYRPGEDRGGKGRSEKDADAKDKKDQDLDEPEEKRGKARDFRTPAGDGKGSSEFRKAFIEENMKGYVVHKFILSPATNEVDMDKYTTEVMDAVSRTKGQDLRYGWVTHDNTDHKHAHVIVLGKDTEGHQVRFSKLDHMRMRAFGDRYLEREHGIEHHLDADMERYARQHALNVMFEHEGKDRFYDLLEKDDKESRKTERDLREWDWVDDDWKKILEEPEVERGLYLGSSQMHHVGRLSEMHSLYQNTQSIDTWQNVLENSPDLKEVAEKKLAELQTERESHLKDLAERTGITDPDKLLASIQDQLASQATREARQLEMALNPEKYEPREWESKDIDLDKVSKDDKIRLSNGEIITKYDSSDLLKETDRELRGGNLDRLDRNDYGKMWSWIGHKEAGGEDFYGTPPLKEIEREQQIDRDQSKSYDRLDLDRVAPDDKVELHTGRIITKYDSLWNLEKLNDRDYDPYYSLDQLSKEDRSRFNSWLIDKRTQGEDVYGRGPREGDERSAAEPADSREQAYKPHQRSEIDLDKVAPEDKIELQDGRIISKYESSRSLERLDDSDWEQGLPIVHLSLEDQQRYWSWLQDKREHGESVYGEPPLKEIDHQQTQPERPRDFLDEASKRDEIEGSTDLDRISAAIAFDNKAIKDLLSTPSPELQEIDRADASEDHSLRESLKVGLDLTGTDEHDMQDFEDELVNGPHFDEIDFQQSMEIEASISGEDGREQPDRETGDTERRDSGDSDREDQGRRDREDHGF